MWPWGAAAATIDRRRSGFPRPTAWAKWEREGVWDQKKKTWNSA